MVRVLPDMHFAWSSAATNKMQELLGKDNVACYCIDFLGKPHSDNSELLLIFLIILDSHDIGRGANRTGPTQGRPFAFL